MTDQVFNAYFHPKLILWMARWGIDDKEIATELGIAPALLEQWRSEHPEVKKSLEDGRAYWLNLAENSLHKLVKGYEWTETIVEADTRGGATKVKKITKHVPPNPQAILFMLEHRPVFKLIKEIEKGLPGGFPISSLPKFKDGR